LHSAVFYPIDYGFITETRAEDGDHLDVLVLISNPTFPGCVLEVRPVGVLDMEDEAGQDWKVSRYRPVMAKTYTEKSLNRRIVPFLCTLPR